MEKTVSITNDVSVAIDKLLVTVKGPNGELKRDFDDPRFSKLIRIENKDSTVRVSNMKGGRTVNAVTGTIAAHIRNMILGVSVGFEYNMKILYTHFPITVSVSGSEVHVKNFFGEKGIRTARIVGSTEVKVDKDSIVLTGPNVEEIGQTVANIERACKLRGRDRRIFQDGIFLTARRLKTVENV